jgi:hypothetical protein
VTSPQKEILTCDHRWDPKWWTIEATLSNGTELGFPTTGYYPYSGDSGAAGVIGKVHDAGSYAVDPNTEKAVFSSLDLKGLAAGTIAFFDNPTVTKNYSLPGYGLFGSVKDLMTVTNNADLRKVPHAASQPTKSQK